LYAQAFDAGGLEVSGEPFRLADGLPHSESGAAAFAASSTGILIFRNTPLRQAAPSAAPGRGAAFARGGATPSLPDRPLRWVTRSGTNELASAPAPWEGVDLSPDGKRAAAHRHDGTGGDVWIFETGQTTPSRFTFDASQDNASPVWSPDGTRIAFSSERNGKRGLYVKLADNSKAEELIVESELPVMPMSWTGNRLVYWSRDPRTSGDIWSVDIAEKKPAAVLQTRADERNPQVSPDGKWIAYSSNETGRSEIYINQFPEGTGRIQVSENGGVFPRWRRDGRELYFMNLIIVGSMMASEIRTSGASVQREVPRVLFQSLLVGATHGLGQWHPFAVSTDGQRFLIPQFDSVVSFGRGRAAGSAMNAAMLAVRADRHASVASTASSSAPITVVLDWTAALKR
jgi:dipeptidyl aminopeptidase/acylaminoacyl peptidase